jgi:hypothetical protein
MAARDDPFEADDELLTEDRGWGRPAAHVEPPDGAERAVLEPAGGVG